MLIAGILLGLLLGLRAGGRLDNLANIQLRWPLLLVAAVIVRFGTEALLNLGVGVVEDLRVPLLAARLRPAADRPLGQPLLPGPERRLRRRPAQRRGHPRQRRLHADLGDEPGGRRADARRRHSALHIVVEGDAADFFLQALVLGDIIPIPIPIIRNVASLGDLFLTAGLAFFLFASVVRVPTGSRSTRRPSSMPGWRGWPGAPGCRGRTPAGASPPRRAWHRHSQDSAALERPTLLGGARPGLASPALALPPERCGARYAVADGRGTAPITLPRPSAETLERVRRHPYVRLGLNGSFTSLWAGQLISLFGDRIHQLALAAAVLVTTGSALATALVFVTATIPNLLFSPIAGTLVDRWDHKEVLVVSDLLRAAVVLLIPIAIVTNILFVYPLVFALTTISIFFRPARVAILPQIVRQDELLTANSALWVGETLADVIGYPLAGLFVVALGSALPIAFWLDAATYTASAMLLSTLVVRPIEHGSERSIATIGAEAAGAAGTGEVGSAARPWSMTSRPASSASSRRAGGSCAASPCCWRTPSRRPSPS